MVTWMAERQHKYYKIGWAYLQNRFDIEDVFQNTILIAHEKRHQLREEQYLETWVTRMFINECKKILKHQQKHSLLPMEEQITDSTPNIKVDVIEGLEQLDEMYSDVIILKYMSGYSQEEIAELLDIAVGTVKSRISRGFMALREIMARGVI